MIERPKRPIILSTGRKQFNSVRHSIEKDARSRLFKQSSKSQLGLNQLAVAQVTSIYQSTNATSKDFDKHNNKFSRTQQTKQATYSYGFNKPKFSLQLQKQLQKNRSTSQTFLVDKQSPVASGERSMEDPSILIASSNWKSPSDQNQDLQALKHAGQELVLPGIKFGQRNHSVYNQQQSGAYSEMLKLKPAPSRRHNALIMTQPNSKRGNQFTDNSQSPTDTKPRHTLNLMTKSINHNKHKLSKSCLLEQTQQYHSSSNPQLNEEPSINNLSVSYANHTFLQSPVNLPKDDSIQKLATDLSDLDIKTENVLSKHQKASNSKQLRMKASLKLLDQVQQTLGSTSRKTFSFSKSQLSRPSVPVVESPAVTKYTPIDSLIRKSVFASSGFNRTATRFDSFTEKKQLRNQVSPATYRPLDSRNISGMKVKPSFQGFNTTEKRFKVAVFNSKRGSADEPSPADTDTRFGTYLPVQSFQKQQEFLMLLDKIQQGESVDNQLQKRRLKYGFKHPIPKKNHFHKPPKQKDPVEMTLSRLPFGTLSFAKTESWLNYDCERVAKDGGDHSQYDSAAEAQDHFEGLPVTITRIDTYWNSYWPTWRLQGMHITYMPVTDQMENSCSEPYGEDLCEPITIEEGYTVEGNFTHIDSLDLLPGQIVTKMDIAPDLSSIIWYVNGLHNEIHEQKGFLHGQWGGGQAPENFCNDYCWFQIGVLWHNSIGHHSLHEVHGSGYLHQNWCLPPLNQCNHFCFISFGLILIINKQIKMKKELSKKKSSQYVSPMKNWAAELEDSNDYQQHAEEQPPPPMGNTEDAHMMKNFAIYRNQVAGPLTQQAAKAGQRKPPTINQIANFMQAAKADRRMSKMSKQTKDSKQKVTTADDVSSYMSSIDKSMESAADDKSHSSRSNASSSVLSSNQSREFRFEIEEHEQKVIPPCLISPTSKFKLVWSILVFILVIQTAVVMPIRIAFIEDGGESDSVFWLVFDCVSDVIFLIDVGLNFIFIEETADGELILDRKKLARRYLKSWFVIDVISSIPISVILLFVEHFGNNHNGDASSTVLSIRFIKLTKTARIQRLLTLVKLMRVFKNQKFVEASIQKVQLSGDTQSIIKSSIRTVFLLHFVGCVWAIIAAATQRVERDNWLRSHGIWDSSVSSRYIASCYWAVVTISTVGYGDITPTNNYERLTCIFLVFFGVSMYSYIISRLTSIFATVQRSTTESQSRDQMLTQFMQKTRLSIELSDKILHFFKRSDTNIIHMSRDINIDQLLNILPSHLKSQVSYVLFKDAIRTIKILQDKDQRFYGEFMSKFVPMRIKAGTCFCEERQQPEEVYFLLAGCILRESSEELAFGIKPHYLIEGTIFGEKDMLLKRERHESYTAVSDCYVLKLSKDLFQDLMDQFEDFNEEVTQIAQERERMRVFQLKKAKEADDDSHRSSGSEKGTKVKTPALEHQMQQEGSEIDLEEYKQVKTKIKEIDLENEEQLKQRAEKKQKEQIKTRRLKILKLKKRKQTMRAERLLANEDYSMNRGLTSMIFDRNKHENSSIISGIQPKNSKRQDSSVLQQKNSALIQPIQCEKVNESLISLDQQDSKVHLEGGEPEKISEEPDEFNMTGDFSPIAGDPDSREATDSFRIEAQKIKKSPTAGQVSQQGPQLLFNFEEGAAPQPEQIDSSINILAQRIKACESHIRNVKHLIQTYKDIFDAELKSMESDDNIQIRKHYEQAVKGIQGYSSLILIVENLIKEINVQQVQSSFNALKLDSAEVDNKFFLMESRVKTIEDMLLQKIKHLEKEKEASLKQKPLILKKKQKSRHDKHVEMNKNLAQTQAAAVLNF